MKPEAILPICLILLGACGPREGTETGTDPAESARSLQPYTLQIIFNGLIAYVEEQDRVWALLVDADYDNSAPENIQEGDLPPCATSEQASLFPPHKPRMRIEGVADASLEGQLIELNGMDVRVNPARKTFRSRPALTNMVEFAQIERSGAIDLVFTKSIPAEVPKESLPELYTVDPRFIADKSEEALGDGSPLGARVLLTSGSIEAKVKKDCGDFRYSFNSPSWDQEKVNSAGGCRATDDGVELAVEVVAEQTELTEPSTVVFENGEKSFELEPRSPGGTVTIWILNQTENALATPEDPCSELPHNQGHRWFYRLSAVTGAADDCADHLFPCEIQGVAAGRRCPTPRFTP